MKRILSFLLCFALLLGSFAVSEEIVVKEGDALMENAPQGLEPLYRLMEMEPSSTAMSYTNVARMPNGRTLVSMSLSYVEQNYSVEQIVSRSARAEAFLEENVISLDGRIAHPEVIDWFGVKVAHYQTCLLLENSLQALAEGLVLPFSDFLMEIWTVSPDASLYEQDPSAAAELQEDLEYAKSFLEVNDDIVLYGGGYVDFVTNTVQYRPSTAAVEVIPLKTESYTTPDGRFRLKIPCQALVLTHDSSEDEWSKAEEHFLSMNPEGAERVFANIRSEVIDDLGIVIFTEDMQGYIELYSEEGWEEKQLDDLAKMAFAIRRSLEKKFGEANLTALCEQEEVSGMTHLRECFDLLAGELELKLCLLSVLPGDGTIRELDIFATTQELQDSLYRMVVDSMVYLDGNAPE